YPAPGSEPRHAALQGGAIFAAGPGHRMRRHALNPKFTPLLQNRAGTTIDCSVFVLIPRRGQMLTRKQHELLMFIHERMKESGIPPSFDEMKDALDLRSKSGIHRLITALEERGFIRRLPN